MCYEVAALTASIATSICLSSGSFVVIFCKANPGYDIIFIRSDFWYLAENFNTSYDEEAIIGINIILCRIYNLF